MFINIPTHTIINPKYFKNYVNKKRKLSYFSKSIFLCFIVTVKMNWKHYIYIYIYIYMYLFIYWWSSSSDITFFFFFFLSFTIFKLYLSCSVQTLSWFLFYLFIYLFFLIYPNLKLHICSLSSVMRLA